MNEILLQKPNYYINETIELLKETGKQWYQINPFRNAAVISYYAIFSLPGLFIIVINLASNFYGREAITNQLSTQIASIVGMKAAHEIETIIASAHFKGDFLWSTVISIAVLIYGATGVFYHIQKSLDSIWKIKTNPDRRITSYLKDRLYSFLMILVIGLLMIASLIISSITTELSGILNLSQTGFMKALFSISGFIVALAIITALFAAIFKVLPDLDIDWKEVLPGAFLTSVLFIIAKFLLGLVLNYSNPGSAYGAAGSIILIMLWVTYSGIILLFGAVFTKVYTKRYGGKVSVNSYAVFLDEADDEDN